MHGKLRVWSAFMLINLMGMGLMALAYLKGWIQLIVNRDVTFISVVIPAVFLVGLLMCYMRIHALNRAFDDLAKRRGAWLQRYRRIAMISTTNASELLKVVLFRKMMWPKSLLWLFPVLGLLGTVAGTMIAFESSMFEGIDNIQEIGQKLVVQMVSGIGIALYTTLVGMVFMIWMYFNIRLLEVESMKLLEQILEAGAIDLIESQDTDVKTEVATGETSTEPAPESKDEGEVSGKEDGNV